MSMKLDNLGVEPRNTAHPNPPLADDDARKRTARIIGKLAVETMKEFDLPYEEQINSLASAAQRHSIDWLNEHNVISKKIDAQQFGMFIGYTHPRADKSKLNLISDFVTWLFLYDDLIEKCTQEKVIAKLHERTIEILRGGDSLESDNSLMQGFYGIIERVDKISDSVLWKERLTQDINHYCEGTLWEYNNRVGRQVPSIDEYKKMRAYTSGTKIMFDFIEIVEDFEIPEEIFNNPYFQQVRSLGANLVNWENDLLSAPKEQLQDDFHNLVLVYENQLRSGYYEAFKRTLKDLKNEWSQFQDLANQVPDYGPHSESVQKYIEGIKMWVAGHHFWAKNSPRYSNYFENVAQEYGQ